MRPDSRQGRCALFSWFKKKQRPKAKPAQLIPRPKHDVVADDLAPIPGRDRREALEKMGGAEEVAQLIRGLLNDDERR